MRLNNTRRVATLAGLALIPALALGAVAQAAASQDAAPAAPASGTTAVASEDRQAAPKEGAEDPDQKIAQRGKISKIELIKDEEGNVTVRFVIYGGPDKVTWVTTPDTVVTEHGKPVPVESLEKGDLVTAFGTPLPDGNAIAEQVEIGGQLPPK